MIRFFSYAEENDSEEKAKLIYSFLDYKGGIVCPS